MTWLWIPITIGAALAQTVRNAAQRNLVKTVGTLGATLVRFLFGLPFALAWLVVVRLGGEPLPGFDLTAFVWCAVGACGQLFATGFLLMTMAERNFAIGVAYSKTEVVQIAIFGLVLLGEHLSPLAIAAVVVATAGVLLMSVKPGEVDLMQILFRGWTSRAALLGLASGAGFAIAAVGYRGAVVTIAPDAAPLMAAAATLVVAQTLQTLLLGGWMFFRSRGALLATLAAWRQSILAGAMGALASAGWFTAFALEPVAHVRTLSLIEIVFSYAVSRRFFRESVARNELWGLIFLALGIVFIVNAG